MNELGFHYRITDFQCAMGITQLLKLTKFIKKREEIAKRYLLSFESMENCKPLLASNPKVKKSNHLFVLKINFKKIKKTKKDLINFLKKKGIGSQVHYIPVPLLNFYKKLGYKMKNLDNAKLYYEQAISIPIFYQLKKKTQNYIIDQLKKFVQK